MVDFFPKGNSVINKFLGDRGTLFDWEVFSVGSTRLSLFDVACISSLLSITFVIEFGKA